MFGKYIKVGPRVYGGLDPDTAAFISTAGITNGTMITALNNMVVSLKNTTSSYGGSFWSRIKNLKPFAAGNAVGNSYNLINTATFQETFVGSPTHNSLGVVFNGTSQYSRCGFVPSTELSTTQGFQYVFLQSGYSNGGCMIGALNSGLRFNLFGEYYECGASFTLGSAVVYGGRSLAIEGSSGFKGYKNGVLDINNITPVSGLPTIQTYLAALNFSTLYYANATISLYAQGSLSPADQSTFNTIVSTFITALGR